MAWKFVVGREIKEQIADRITIDLLTGAIAPEQRLPDVSDMSRITGVSANTVVDAYNTLIREGIVLNKGVLVFNPDMSSARERRERIAQSACARLSDELTSLGYNPKEQMQLFGKTLIGKNNS